MSQYDNRDKGVLFRNDDKRSDGRPDYRGNINVGGTEYWLSAWIKASKKGSKFMSLSVQPKLMSDRASPPTGGRNDPRPVNDGGFDDGFDSEIPF